MTSEEEHYFYGQPIVRREQQEYIRKLLDKWRKMPVDEELKEKVWKELQEEKCKGNITIPFKVAIRKDASGRFPPCIEVILDTKV